MGQLGEKLGVFALATSVVLVIVVLAFAAGFAIGKLLL
jgi:hypothetical protein